MVRIKWAINIQVLNMSPDDFSRLVTPSPGYELAKIESLGRRHEFDPKDSISIIKYLIVFQGCVHAH